MAKVENDVSGQTAARTDYKAWQSSLADMLDFLEGAATIKGNAFNVPEIVSHNERVARAVELIRPHVFGGCLPTSDAGLAACNSHADLVRALERLLKTIDSGSWRDRTELSIAAHPAVDDARSALAPLIARKAV